MIGWIADIVCRFRGCNNLKVYDHGTGVSYVCTRCGCASFRFDPPIEILPGQTVGVEAHFRLEDRG